MKFIVDNCLSPKYSTILGFVTTSEVVALRDEFPENEQDPDWIREIGSRGWTFVTVDRAQLRTLAEAAAIATSGAVGICLAKKFSKMKLHEQAWRLMRAWPEIVRVASSAARGSCYIVSENGKVERHRPK